MKYVINEKFGGFRLSQEAIQWLIDYKDWKIAPENRCENLYYPDALKLIEDGYRVYTYNCEHNMIGPLLLLDGEGDLSFRSNPDVVEVVEVLGEKANGRHADLIIVECPHTPDSGLIEVHDYDGKETLQIIPETFG